MFLNITTYILKYLTHSGWLDISTCYFSGVFVCNLWFLLIVRVNVVFAEALSSLWKHVFLRKNTL